MACGICSKVLLALVVCLTFGIQGNSAYHIPVSSDESVEDFSPEYRAEPSEVEYSASSDDEQDFRMARNARHSHRHAPFGTKSLNGDCQTEHQHQYGEGCHTVPHHHHRGLLCFAKKVDGCGIIRFYRTSECREPHSNTIGLSDPIGHEVKYFYLDYSGCFSSEVSRDDTGRVGQQRSLSSPDENAVSDYQVDGSRVPSRWFQVKLREFMENGDRLTPRL